VFVRRYEDESDTSIDRSTFTLADMAEWGLQHPTMATDALVDLLDELKQVTEFPVLIAIDGHNLLYDSPTVYPRQDGSGKLLRPEELSIPAALQCLDERGVK
jgi:Mitochondrial ribosomal death-associated protein 3